MSKEFKAYGQKDIDRIPQLTQLSDDLRLDVKVAASVLPFRINDHVLEELIDWDAVPNDPIFQLLFPQREMLEAQDFETLRDMHLRGATPQEIKEVARAVQLRNNPHPAGQMELNVPRIGSQPVSGIQHKYRETVLFFPAQGQTCHSYCTYCFRWPQFVGIDELKFAGKEADTLVQYLQNHSSVTNVLFTGGDPMVMRTKVLRRYIEPLLQQRPGGLTTIRIGTKSPVFWPYRFTQGEDADDLLRLFEEVVASGLHLALMLHNSHPREIENAETERALKRIIATGAVVRCQAPLIRHVNDDAKVWSDMWRRQVALGAVPYYMFVERDTGPRSYFEVPLGRAYQIFRDAYANVSGLARTARGPSMSTTHGKVVVDGVLRLGAERYFSLRFLQARAPELVGRPFLAEYDPQATWFDQLRPAPGQDSVFFKGVRVQRHGPARLSA